MKRDIVKAEETSITDLLPYLHGNASGGKSKLLREIGITRRQFAVLGMRYGFSGVKPMTYGEIADHFRISATAARKCFLAAEEKVTAWARVRTRI